MFFLSLFKHWQNFCPYFYNNKENESTWMDNKSLCFTGEVITIQANVRINC